MDLTLPFHEVSGIKCKDERDWLELASSPLHNFKKMNKRNSLIVLSTRTANEQVDQDATPFGRPLVDVVADLVLLSLHGAQIAQNESRAEKDSNDIGKGRVENGTRFITIGRRCQDNDDVNGHGTASTNDHTIGQDFIQPIQLDEDATKEKDGPRHESKVKDLNRNVEVDLLKGLRERRLRPARTVEL